MDIEYFFQDSNDNKSIKTLFEKKYKLESIHQKKKNNDEKQTSDWVLVIPMGMFFLICGLFITFTVGLFSSWVKDIFDNHYGKILLFYFLLPFFLIITINFFTLIEENKNKKELDKKLGLFYHEDNYIPILKKLDIFNDLSEKGKRFLINLNNKNLTQSDISYIFKKYEVFTFEDNQLKENDIIDNIKHKVLNSNDKSELEVNKKINFFS